MKQRNAKWKKYSEQKRKIADAEDRARRLIEGSTLHNFVRKDDAKALKDIDSVYNEIRASGGQLATPKQLAPK